MIVVVDERELVKDGYTSLFGREGIPSTGFDPREFGELHKNVLVAAPDIKSAKQKALKQVNDWIQPHKDRIFEIEQAIDLTALTGQHGYTLSLRPATDQKPFVFQCLYLPLG